VQGPQQPWDTLKTPPTTARHVKTNQSYLTIWRYLTTWPCFEMESALAAIRPPLQSITHNLPKPVQDLALSLLGPECYTHLVLDINPSDVECLKLAISKALGTAIVGVSGIVKIPQLLKLLQSGSAQGVSFVSYALETAAYLITLAYNARQGNPFSTYGENALISAQNVAIAALVLTYQGQGAGAISYIAGLAGMVYALFNESLVDGKMMSMLQAGAGVLGVASKVPQIVTIWQEGSTGQLSAFAVPPL